MISDFVKKKLVSFNTFTCHEAFTRPAVGVVRLMMEKQNAHFHIKVFTTHFFLNAFPQYSLMKYAT